jgi:hypothetical protein
MGTRLPVAAHLRTRHPFPIRVVVSALRALADDLDTIDSGGSIHLAERVAWVRKSVENAEAWLYLLHTVCDRAGLSGTQARELAQQYQNVMTTRRTPVRPFTAGGRRTAPPLPPRMVDPARPAARRQVDEG